MSKSSEFFIENGSDSAVFLYVEPEGVVVSLKPDEAVVVHDEYLDSPVTIRVSTDDSGTKVLSIWPGDGHTIVKKDGQDVMDII